jgi:hypothetical protein
MASGATIQRRRREATERRDDLCVWAGWLRLDGRAVPGWQAAAHVAAEAAVETEGREDGAGGGPAEGRRRGSRVHVTPVGPVRLRLEVPVPSARHSEPWLLLLDLRGMKCAFSRPRLHSGRQL